MRLSCIWFAVGLVCCGGCVGRVVLSFVVGRCWCCVLLLMCVGVFFFWLCWLCCSVRGFARAWLVARACCFVCGCCWCVFLFGGVLCCVGSSEFLCWCVAGLALGRCWSVGVFVAVLFMVRDDPRFLLFRKKPPVGGWCVVLSPFIVVRFGVGMPSVLRLWLGSASCRLWLSLLWFMFVYTLLRLSSLFLLFVLFLVLSLLGWVFFRRSPLSVCVRFLSTVFLLGGVFRLPCFCRLLSLLLCLSCCCWLWLNVAWVSSPLLSRAYPFFVFLPAFFVFSC